MTSFVNLVLKLILSHTTIQKGRRAYVYIDALNLYHRLLKGTPYRWLDVVAMCEALLRHYEILKIKYFTARVHNLDGSGVSQRQDLYLRALARTHPSFEIIHGELKMRRNRGFLLTKMEGDPGEIVGITRRNDKGELVHSIPGPREVVGISKYEEKRTDVNIAAHLINDCWQDLYDCAVIVSNDSDLTGAIEMVKSMSNKQIGFIPPVGRRNKRKISRELRDCCDFMVIISKHILQSSQLPDKIPGTDIHKPDDW